MAGEAYVVQASEEGLIGRLEEAAQVLQETDWRVCDIAIVPISREAFERRSVEE